MDARFVLLCFVSFRFVFHIYWTKHGSKKYITYSDSSTHARIIERWTDILCSIYIRTYILLQVVYFFGIQIKSMEISEVSTSFDDIKKIKKFQFHILYLHTYFCNYSKYTYLLHTICTLS